MLRAARQRCDALRARTTGRAWPVGAWLLALALVAAQAFALVHGVVHGGHAGPAPHAHALAHVQAHAPAHEQAHAHDRHDDPHGHGLIERLFGAHHDDLDCRLYDQLGHADAAPVLAAVALPLALPAAVFDFLSGAFIARRAALFEARGPPSVR